MSDSSDSRVIAPLLAPLLTMGAMGLMSEATHAEDPEPLEEEFLDYLLQLEGEDEDWTLFDSQESEPAPQATASKTAPGESATPVKTPGEKPQTAAPIAKTTNSQTSSAQAPGSQAPGSQAPSIQSGGKR
jgi:hypothetical protein